MSFISGYSITLAKFSLNYDVGSGVPSRTRSMSCVVVVDQDYVCSALTYMLVCSPVMDYVLYCMAEVHGLCGQCLLLTVQ